MSMPVSIPTPNRLPAPVEFFLGRENEVDSIVEYLRNDRENPASGKVYVIHGSEGTGKTELSRVAAQRVQSEYADARIYLKTEPADRGDAPLYNLFELIIHIFEPLAHLSDDLEILHNQYLTALKGNKVLIVLDDLQNNENLKLLIPPADGITVTVRSNNTVSGFASKYKVSSQKIIAANGMSGPTLTVGQLLVIPVNPVPAIPSPKPATARSVKAWNGGKLRWPVPGYTRLSQGYWSGHRAIDIPAPTGTPVVAAYGGTVIFAGWKYSGSDGYGGGLVVWISHGGKLWTTYNHLSAEFVHLGQVVSAGQRIGSIGMTGNATGPHLHFEVWSCYPWTGGTTACARNPLSYL